MGKRKRNRKRNKHKKSWEYEDFDTQNLFDNYEEREFLERRKQKLKNAIRQKISEYTSKSESQRKLEKIIDSCTISIGLGSAGTGKSYVALAKALDLFCRPNKEYDKIVVFHPLVQVDDTSLGYLPGDIDDKINPFKGATLHTLTKILGENLVDQLMYEKIIEFQPINYVRGWTFDNNILILEEAQNTSIGQMKTLLTRVGENTKFIIIGDVRQSDKFEGMPSGLKDAYSRLAKVKGVGRMAFDKSDVVRSGIVLRILQEYEKDEDERHEKVRAIKQKPYVDTSLEPRRLLESENPQKGYTPVHIRKWWKIFGK